MNDVFLHALTSDAPYTQVLIVLICMAVIISKTEVNWAAAFDGFVPSKTLFQAGGLYTCTSRAVSFSDVFHIPCAPTLAAKLTSSPQRLGS